MVTMILDSDYLKHINYLTSKSATCHELDLSTAITYDSTLRNRANFSTSRSKR